MRTAPRTRGRLAPDVYKRQRSIRLDLPRFTLVGATTKAGMLSSPLRDRFGIVHRLQPYSTEDLVRIITRSAALPRIGAQIEPEGRCV